MCWLKIFSFLHSSIRNSLRHFLSPLKLPTKVLSTGSHLEYAHLTNLVSFKKLPIIFFDFFLGQSLLIFEIFF